MKVIEFQLKRNMCAEDGSNTSKAYSAGEKKSNEIAASL